MALYAEQGLILRTMKLGEADRIVSVLTQGEGKIRAVAKGVRKTKSRFGGRLEPFTHVDLLLYRGRELDIVTQADILSPFRGLREDYGRFTAASIICEAAEKISEERERNARLFLLTLNSLRALEDTASDARATSDSFLLRLASLSGFRPSLEACAECGATAVKRFSVHQGGMVCDRCRDGGAISVGEATVPYMLSLLAETPEPVGDGTRGEAGAIIRTYLEHHLNRPLRSWGHLERA
ncbi:MAG: DNA repair protein RecO [Actinomycetota bacterium]